MHQMGGSRHPKESGLFSAAAEVPTRQRPWVKQERSSKERTVFVNIETAADNKKKKRCSGAIWLVATLILGCLGAGVPMMAAQSSPSQTPADQTKPAQTQPAQDIPDAPTVQPAEKPEPSAIP